jgi:uncharacterized membrane protein HdeD (DUF308 family)
MKTFLQATWWLLLLRGLALLLVGFFALAWPGLTLHGFIVGFAIYILVVGVLNMITTLSSLGRLPLWFLNMVLAALEVGVGVYALRHLTMAAATLVLLVGLVLVVRGILEVISAYGDGYDSRNRSLVAITGILSLAAGILVWAYPGTGALAFTWIIGLYGIVVGSFLIAIAIEARNLLGLTRA